MVLSICEVCAHKKCCKMFWVPLLPEESKRLPVDWNGWIPSAAVLPRKENGECIFLNAEGRCEIYQSRPLACREYFCIRDARINGKA
jgi:Fe-S-cluster containining protein